MINDLVRNSTNLGVAVVEEQVVVYRPGRGIRASDAQYHLFVTSHGPLLGNGIVEKVRARRIIHEQRQILVIDEHVAENNNIFATIGQRVVDRYDRFGGGLIEEVVEYIHPALFQENNTGALITGGVDTPDDIAEGIALDQDARCAGS